MPKNIFRGLLLFVSLVLALPLAAGKVKYPKTSPCPIDGVTAKATGKTTPTLDPECLSVEYKHKWTDYTSHVHPQRMQHEFWLNICADAATAKPTPSK